MEACFGSDVNQEENEGKMKVSATRSLYFCIFSKAPENRKEKYSHCVVNKKGLTPFW